MKIAYTRAMINAALAGTLEAVPFVPDPVFGVLVPQSCPGVPGEVLTPRSTWPDPAAYDAQASRLAELFRKNFQQFEGVPAAVRDSGPAART
jgi:phosphoenolpyruvate carboxykinase (ATP)